MPYKRVGKRVYVYKGGRWRLKKKHKTAAEAKAHAAALNANVEHKGRNK
jgi:hypothetical protein